MGFINIYQCVWALFAYIFISFTSFSYSRLISCFLSLLLSTRSNCRTCSAILLSNLLNLCKYYANIYLASLNSAKYLKYFGEFSAVSLAWINRIFPTSCDSIRMFRHRVQVVTILAWKKCSGIRGLYAIWTSAACLSAIHNWHKYSTARITFYSFIFVTYLFTYFCSLFGVRCCCCRCAEHGQTNG